MSTTADKPKAKGSTDTTSTSGNRFVVSLPADVGEMIDKVGAQLAKAVAEQTGVAFELSRAQIVQSLVRQALVAADAKNGDSDSATE